MSNIVNAAGDIGSVPAFALETSLCRSLKHVRIFEHRIYHFTHWNTLKTSASTDEVCLQCLDVNLPWGQRDAQLGKKPNFAPSRRTVKSLILESYTEIYCIYLYYLYCIQYIHAYQYYIQDIQIKIYYLVNKHLVFPFITWVFFLSSWKCA